MAIIRTFISAELSGTSSALITSVQAKLLKLVTPSGIKLTPLQQVHLTLAFLGDVDTRLIAGLINALESSNVELPILVDIDRIGQFCRNGVVSVVWAGIKQNKSLENLYLAVVNQIRPLVKLEKVPFRPHLTLARVRPEIDAASNARLIEFSNSNQLTLPVQESIQEVVVFKSKLKPSGPIYTRLHTIKQRDRIQ
jgi:2'-5' RNA ligase